MPYEHDIIEAPDGQLWWVKDPRNFANTTVLVAMVGFKEFADPHRELWVTQAIKREWAGSPFMEGVQVMDISDWKKVGAFKPKKTSKVVAQYSWTAVKEMFDPSSAGNSYDVWEWNLFKMKWVRLSNTACGFGTKSDASRCAEERSEEIAQMLRNNSAPPKPL